MDERDSQAVIDADIDATKPAPLARVGGMLVMLGGFVGILNAFQSIVLVGVSGWYVSVAGAALAAIGAILAIGPCLRSTAARKRLMARGMDTGM